ncbi:MAG: alpha/beta hydrolase [Rhodobiaceae bacterium]|nr:alpha/beta hydrolase [Rhodobiaceae bacterium]
MPHNKISIDPAIFDPASISAETKAVNVGILKALASLPDQWTFPPQVIRDRRAQGLGPFPVAPKSEQAREITIDGRDGRVGLRIIAPQMRASRGVYLHIHGGGWVLGAPNENDMRLERIAENTGLTTVSVDYRLAPEHPYPAGPDDCEAAALWLVNGGLKELGGGVLAIGGESAGAHLSVLTLLRLRDDHAMMPFVAANLVAGCYDLRLSPSVRRWGAEKLILNTRDITKFCEAFVQGDHTVEDPAINPILADLAGLCPALFSVGTRDPLLDDTLMMAPLWMAAGNAAELAVFAGGAHVFQAFPGKLAQASLQRMDDFLNAALDGS